eukprot:7376472-Prymnesium_polylepis.1
MVRRGAPGFIVAHAHGSQQQDDVQGGARHAVGRVGQRGGVELAQRHRHRRGRHHARHRRRQRLPSRPQQDRVPFDRRLELDDDVLELRQVGRGALDAAAPAVALQRPVVREGLHLERRLEHQQQPAERAAVECLLDILDPVGATLPPRFFDGVPRHTVLELRGVPQERPSVWHSGCAIHGAGLTRYGAAHLHQALSCTCARLESAHHGRLAWRPRRKRSIRTAKDKRGRRPSCPRRREQRRTPRPAKSKKARSKFSSSGRWPMMWPMADDVARG